ncbi:unnamed protein product, partial [Gongylonema pulchrum]|uniref:AhpC-TSA domain-containing protein n=1 Tax=Gongylonema pulchrum TaxID=637853 RepID=A0A183DIV7_9BILA
NWAILFSHPHDFSPVYSTELVRLIQLAPQFQKRHVKLLGLSCDSMEAHRETANDMIAYCKSHGGGGDKCCGSGNMKRISSYPNGKMEGTQLSEGQTGYTAGGSFQIVA